MKNQLKVQEFSKKRELLEYVNINTEKFEIVSTSSTQEAISYRLFLWYFEKFSFVEFVILPPRRQA